MAASANKRVRRGVRAKGQMGLQSLSLSRSECFYPKTSPSALNTAHSAMVIFTVDEYAEYLTSNGGYCEG